MGCKATKPGSNQPSERQSVIASEVVSNKVEILPSTFVQINENRFEQMYKVGQLLGEGAQSEVRRCVHRDTRQVRAVKITNKQVARRENDILRELELLKSLDHPNIVRVFEYFVDHRYIFLVMEYCQGGQLQGRITTQMQFSERQVATIMKQLFSAVVYLRDAGVAHREICPEKILLEDKSGDINLKIIDFGSAVTIGAGSKRDEPRFTHFASPELLQCSGSASSCDLWSCGVLMFVLLSGRFPFEGATAAETKGRVLEGKFHMNSGLWNSVSAEAKQLITAILKPEEERISAREAMDHEWFARFDFNVKVPQSFVQSVLSNVLKFQFSTKLQLAALTFISTQLLSLQDTKDLREVFRLLDRNGDGRISKNELIEVYRETMPPSEAEKAVTQIMARADTDGSGFMDYTEFLRASIDLKSLLTEKLLAEVFSVFDRDGNGTITLPEIIKVLQGNSLTADESVWSSILSEVDKNGDGVIDILEFKELLLAKM